ncbi:hypothetical protein [Streptomyces sp. NPDC096132]|uniref:hypothetical protein n=1 Tax=Streptomyces sp. NPDC096132 TaxID=3366075 RepID=UPI0037F13FFB
MGNGSRLRGWAFGGVVCALFVLTACAGPYQYYGGTGLHDATAAEAAGTWANVDETRLTLRRDGTALVSRLDGATFDFDDGWRLSGTGTWKLTDDSDGQEVHVTLTTRTGVDTRANADTDRSAVDLQPPSTYTWHFYVDRDDRDALVLFFLYGDPDVGNTYVMSRV